MASIPMPMPATNLPPSIIERFWAAVWIVPPMRKTIVPTIIALRRPTASARFPTQIFEVNAPTRKNQILGFKSSSVREVESAQSKRPAISPFCVSEGNPTVSLKLVDGKTDAIMPRSTDAKGGRVRGAEEIPTIRSPHTITERD